MSDGGEQLYKSLRSWARIQDLIEDGAVEDIHLEAKAPSQPKINKDTRVKLARAVSGFSNTEGGVILWGVATTKHLHDGSDVITQIEPVGNCERFGQAVQQLIPTLTTPPVTASQSRILTKRKKDTRGVVVTYIPKNDGDPVQSNSDNLFYFRSGDEFRPLPYELIRRLFAATDSPSLILYFDPQLATIDNKGIWTIPLFLTNQSSAIAEHIAMTIEIINDRDCDELAITNFHDVSRLNPGRRFFAHRYVGVIHKSMPVFFADLRVRMKSAPKPRRALKLVVETFANRMRAKRNKWTLTLTKSNFRCNLTQEGYVD